MMNQFVNIFKKALLLWRSTAKGQKRSFTNFTFILPYHLTGYFIQEYIFFKQIQILFPPQKTAEAAAAPGPSAPVPRGTPGSSRSPPPRRAASPWRRLRHAAERRRVAAPGRRKKKHKRKKENAKKAKSFSKKYYIELFVFLCFFQI